MAADAYLGKDAYLKIGATSAATEISGAGNGLRNVRLMPSVEVRPVPGTGTAVHHQSMEKVTEKLEFECDANSVTWPLLHRKHGETIHFELGPIGNTASQTPALPKLTGSGVVADYEQTGDVGDALSFSIGILVDGSVTEGTY